MAAWPDIWKMQIYLIEEKMKMKELRSSYLECIWNTIAVSFFLAHLLMGISCVIYIYLLGECVRCKVVFIRI